MDQLPPSALKVFAKLPSGLQAQLQLLAIKSMQNPYLPAMLSMPAMLGLAYVPHTIKLVLMFIEDGIYYDNEHPRSHDLPNKKFHQWYVRCKSAHENSLEVFPAFAAAVLAARINKADPITLAKLSGSVLGLRFLYILAYVFGVHKAIALFRTVLFFAAYGKIMDIYALLLQ